MSMLNYTGIVENAALCTLWPMKKKLPCPIEIGMKCITHTISAVKHLFPDCSRQFGVSMVIRDEINCRQVTCVTVML